MSDPALKIERTSNAPSPGPTFPRSAERRRSVRIPHVIEAWINSPTATHAEERREVTCMNLSRHGAGFLFSEPLPTSAFYVLEIGLGEQRMISEVRIVSCKATENGQYEIGAEFC
jgi:hypothetical protein